MPIGKWYLTASVTLTSVSPGSRYEAIVAYFRKAQMTGLTVDYTFPDINCI
jgi:hypothetical protein